MFCNDCGAENPDATKFCSNCGAAIRVVVEQEVEPKLGLIAGLVKFVKAERPLGIKVITAYYVLGGIVMFGFAVAGFLGLILSPLSTVSIDNPTAWWKMILTCIIVSFLCLGTAAAAWEMHELGWFAAMILTVWGIFDAFTRTGSLDGMNWLFLIIGVATVWYLWRNSDTSHGYDDD